MENLKMVSSEISCRVYVIFIKTFFSSLLKGDSETWRNSFKVSYKIKVFLQQGSPFTHNGHTDKHRRFVSLRTILPLFFSRHVFIVVCPYNVTITFFNRWNQNCHLATHIRSFKMFILLRYIKICFLLKIRGYHHLTKRQMYENRICSYIWKADYLFTSNH